MNMTSILLKPSACQRIRSSFRGQKGGNNRLARKGDALHDLVPPSGR